MARTKKRTIISGIVFVAILGAIVAVGIWPAPNFRVWSWLVILGLMTLSIMMAGYNIRQDPQGRGLWHGCLIDGRNKISLSRLQMILWTILVLSGYLVAVFANIRAGVADPLSVAVPEELWILMGITTTSLVGSPLVLSTKTGKSGKKPSDEQRKATLDRLKAGGEMEIRNDGLVVEYADPADAQWADLFRGEETGNAANLDLSKIQMFYFTFIIWISYAVALGGSFFAGGSTFDQLPAVSGGMLALLGISNTGYLGHKALPLSKEG